MKMSKVFLAAVTFVLLSGPFSAHANLIWTWTGDCQRILQGDVPPCAHAAMLVVTTDAYIPGEEFSLLTETRPSPLLEALYADDNAIIDFAARFNSSGRSFLLPASPSEGGFIDGEQFGFLSGVFPSIFPTGFWRSEGEDVLPNSTCEPNNPHNPFCSYKVEGDNGVWRVPEPRVPAPSTLVLLGVGLVGLAFSRRRR